MTDVGVLNLSQTWRKSGRQRCFYPLRCSLKPASTSPSGILWFGLAETAPRGHLGVARNFPVGIKCIHTIYGAAQAPEIIGYYRRVQNTLKTVLSSLSGTEIGTAGGADPPDSPLP